MGEDRSETDRAAMLRWAADEGRLLQGENPASTHPDDALHWVQVYEELRRLKSEMIDETERQRGRVRAEGQPEVEMDLEMLRIQTRRLEARREFWRVRGLELGRRE